MADYVEVPDFTTGDNVGADQLDVYLRGNFKSVYDALVAGHLVRLDATGKHLEDAGFSTIVAKRQGGSATDWNTSGTTNYTPSAPKIQVGVATVAVSSSKTGTFDVTFPVAFTNKPWICLHMEAYESGSQASPLIRLYPTSITNTTFRIVLTVESVETFSWGVAWIAIGE